MIDRISDVNVTYIGERNCSSEEDVLSLFTETVPVIVGHGSAELSWRELAQILDAIMLHLVGWEFKLQMTLRYVRIYRYICSIRSFIDIPLARRSSTTTAPRLRTPRTMW